MLAWMMQRTVHRIQLQLRITQNSQWITQQRPVIHLMVGRFLVWILQLTIMERPVRTHPPLQLVGETLLSHPVSKSSRICVQHLALSHLLQIGHLSVIPLHTII